MRVILLVIILIFSLQSWANADNLPVFVKSENNWIQKKEKDEWITKKDKKKWITKKDTKEWITKKAGTTNDLSYITLLPLAIIIIYIKRTFR